MKVLVLVLVVCAFTSVNSANDPSDESTFLTSLFKALRKLTVKGNPKENGIITKSEDISPDLEEELKEKDEESMIDVENGVEKHNTNIKPKETADEGNDMDIPDPKESRDPNVTTSDDSLKRQFYEFLVPNHLWKNAVVPYYYGDRAVNWTNDHKAAVRKGFKLWEDTTCIRFQEFSSKQAAIDAGNTEYLDVGPGSRCRSLVGAWWPTVMTLGEGCLGSGTVCHEAGHAIGLAHIHSRDDRDQYVKVNVHNVHKNYRYYYKKVDTLNVVPYDYQSIMHYGQSFAIRSGVLTIETLDKRLQFLVGSRGEPTHYDVKMVNTVYGCTKKCPANDCQNTGYPGPSPACKCQCPDLLTGDKCQSLTTTGLSKYDRKCFDIWPAICPINSYESNCKIDFYQQYCRKSCSECSDDPPNPSCTGIFELENGKSKTLSTPKATHGKCLWLVKVNLGFKVRLNITEFAVARNKSSGDCHHWLEVRYNLVSQKGPKFCGKGWTDGHIDTSWGGDVRYMVLRYDSIKASNTALRGFSGIVTSVKLQRCGSPAVTGSIVTGDQHWEGITVTIACKKGYIHKSGDLERFCKNGKWSGVATVCIVNKCDGKINKKGNKNCKSRVGFDYCTKDPSYMAHFCTRACCEQALLNGSLTYCGPPPPVAGGSIQGTDYAVDGKITITCTGDLSLVSGDSDRTCLKSGKWSGKIPVCKGVNCGPLTVSNGKVEGKDFSFGDKVTISCLKGYLLTSGDKGRTCQANNTWTGVAAVCTENLCLAKSDKSSKSHCDYWVRKKYCTEKIGWMKGHCVRSCCENDLKHGTVAYCGTPPPVAGGSIQGTDFAADGKITITCTGDLSLVSGDSERTCGKDGKWSGTTPVCRSVNCGPLTVSNANVKGTDFSLGDKVTISCLKGYLLTSGDKERSCQANNTWSGVAAVCKENICFAKSDKSSKNSCDMWIGLKYCTEQIEWMEGHCARSCCEKALKHGTVAYCGTPPPIAGGGNQGTDFAEGGKITITCTGDLNFVAGDSERKCGKDGKWSGTTPVCKKNICLAKSDKSHIASCNSWVRIKYCTEKIGWMEGHCARSCCENALKHGTVAYCGTPPSVAGGSIQGTDFADGGKITITCTGDRSLLSGDSERTCGKDGKWSGTTPVCKSVKCGPLTVSNGKVEGKDFSFGNKVTISCLKGYFLTSGDKERTCQANKTWSGPETVCKFINCGPLTVPNGKVEGQDYSFRKMVKISCLKGYLLTSGDKERICMEDGTWSGEASMCEENTCLDKSDKSGKSSCSYWLRYCTGGSYSEWMKGKCVRSCCENALKRNKGTIHKGPLYRTILKTTGKRNGENIYHFY